MKCDMIKAEFETNSNEIMSLKPPSPSTSTNANTIQGLEKFIDDKHSTYCS